MGTIAGVTEHDPRGPVNDSLDVVPVADIVQNAGGIACEFSDGGAWRAQGSDDFAFNLGWRGAAVFIIPNAAAAAGELAFRGACGDPNGGARSVCSSYFSSGGAVVNLVLSWNDRGATFTAIRDHIAAIVAAATITPGPIARALGTFDPPHDCASLISAESVSAILGAPGAVSDRAVEVEFAAESTYLTENIGCEWWVDDLPVAVEVLVFPGGGWAADLTLAGPASPAVELAGMRETDTASTHCVDVSQWGFWLCTVELVSDGTWIHATGNAESEQVATAAAVAAAEAVLEHRP